MRPAPSRTAAVVAAVAVTCGVVAAAPAGADPLPPLPTVRLHGPVAVGVRPGAEPSPIGAGYVAFVQPGYVSSVGATFKVPSFTCADGGDQEWVLPGVFILDANGVFTEQASVGLNCNAGARTQVATISAGGVVDRSLQVNPGDKVEVSLSETSVRTIGRIYDRTQHTTAQAIGAAAPNDATVLVGDLGPEPFALGTGVPTFTKVAFSTVTINGQYLTDANPSAFDLNTSGDTQVKVGGVTSGTHFVTTFVQNS